MFNVYYRHRLTKKLHQINVSNEPCALEARFAVMRQLKTEGILYNRPVLVVVQGGKQ